VNREGAGHVSREGAGHVNREGKRTDMSTAALFTIGRVLLG
jgi:hypothetical protein